VTSSNNQSEWTKVIRGSSYVNNPCVSSEATMTWYIYIGRPQSGAGTSNPFKVHFMAEPDCSSKSLTYDNQLSFPFARRLEY
jgi:hypothetical protein